MPSTSNSTAGADEERAEVVEFRDAPISLGFPPAPVRNGVGESAINAAFTDGPAREATGCTQSAPRIQRCTPGRQTGGERKLHG